MQSFFKIFYNRQKHQYKFAPYRFIGILAYRIDIQSVNNRIHVHNLETKSELKLKLNRNWVRTIRINADGNKILAYTGTKIEKGGSTKFNLNGGAVEDIEVSPDEKYVAVATHNKVDIYDFDTQEKIITFNAGDYSSPGYRSSQTIEQIAFTPCGRYLLALTGNGILGKWNLDIPFDDSAVLELSNEMRLFAPLSNKDIEQLKIKWWLR